MPNTNLIAEFTCRMMLPYPWKNVAEASTISVVSHVLYLPPTDPIQLHSSIQLHSPNPYFVVFRDMANTYDRKRS